MSVADKRAAAKRVRQHVATLERLLNPVTARSVQPDEVRAAIACLKSVATALDRNATTEN